VENAAEDGYQKMKVQYVFILFLLVATMFVVPACSNTLEDSSMENGAHEKLEKATFAGGCFWCMEPPFEVLDGVDEVIAGYTKRFHQGKPVIMKPFRLRTTQRL
jgi:hypothetical protein